MSQAERTFLKKILQDDKAQYPNLKPDEHFELFSATQVLKKYELDPNEIESGLVDGGNDGQVDAIYSFANRRLIREDTKLPTRQEQVNIDLVIVTARSGQGSFDADVLTKLLTTANHLLDPSAKLSAVKQLYNQSLLDSVERFRSLYLGLRKYHPNLTIRIDYVTMGEEVSEHVKKAKDELIARIATLYSPVACDVRLIGAKHLLTMFDQSPPNTLELITEKQLPLGKGAYVSIVTLPNFFAFVADSDKELLRRIFESNVRDYQGNVKVNKDIRDTLVNGQDNEEFWWLNNGITILASDLRGDGETLVIDDPQIVNGLQTSREIHAHFRNQAKLNDRRHILVRVIKTQNSATRDRIIKATNSQTSIPSPWLHATEDVHRHIEKYFGSHELYYDRRKNYYRNQGKPPDRVVTIPWLAQAIMAVALGRPGDARARPSTVLEKDYRQVFSKSYQPELYLNCAQLMKRVGRFLQAKSLTRTTKNNIEFHVAMYASCLALKQAGPHREKAKNLEASTVN